MKNYNIEIWGDVVGLRDLVFSIIGIAASSLLAYSFGTRLGSGQLFFGLLGAVLGFIIVSSLIRPKRIIEEED